VVGSTGRRCLWLTMLAACGRVQFDVVPIDGSSGDGTAAPDARSAMVARLEAESAQITAPFQIALDPDAIGGRYLVDANPMGQTGPGDAVYAFTLPAAGSYWVWGRSRATGQADDSMFLQIDGGADFNYFTVDCVYGNWRWVVLTTPHNCPGPGSPQELVLSAGPHTLRLHSREGGASVDAIAIVDDVAFVPTD